VPAELIIATICTESSGKPDDERREPGFVDYETTPGRVSIGLMQTLISTARETLRMPEIDAAWLLQGDNSIRAGTAYIARQRAETAFDPPVVACAYNAGSVIENASPTNRWRMKQFPIGTDAHANRFVEWFNDCFRMYAADAGTPALSFFALLHADGAPVVG
jgi:Transglycosylase SLT domain